MLNCTQFKINHILMGWVGLMQKTYTDHVSNGVGRLGAEHDHAHGDSSRLSGDGVILVQIVLELLVGVLPVRAHCGQTQAQATTVAHHLHT